MNEFIIEYPFTSSYILSFLICMIGLKIAIYENEYNKEMWWVTTIPVINHMIAIFLVFQMAIYILKFIVTWVPKKKDILNDEKKLKTTEHTAKSIIEKAKGK